MQQDELSVKMSYWTHHCMGVYCMLVMRLEATVSCSVFGCMTLTIALIHNIAYLIYSTSTVNFRPVWASIYLTIKLFIWEFVPYRSLPKECPWAKHLTSLPKKGVGTLSTVSDFNNKKAPTSCLQQIKALEVNNWTQNNIKRNHQRLQSQVLMAHNTLNGTMWRWA